MAINPAAPSPNFRNAVSENIEDPVSYELMTKAVTLVPCGHILNEDTAIQYPMSSS
jgi:leucine-rich repeat protein SHOC2